MRRIQLLLVCLLLISGSMTAQEKGPKRKHISYEQMTALMTKELQLNAKQQKKVAKLNKKYKTLIEGEERKAPERQRPDMGDMPQGGPDGGFGGGGDFGGGGFGGGMPGGGGGMGRPMGGGMSGGQAAEKSYDYDKKQQKYDKAIKKILSESQMQGYEKIKPQFASQRRVKEFLLGGQQELTH